MKSFWLAVLETLTLHNISEALKQMQTVRYHNTGFVPYSGGAIGGAQAHIARVIADGGQGVDADTTTAFFNLFPGQFVPSTMQSFTDPFLGYKLGSDGRVIKMYSASGAAGDTIAPAGAGPTIVGSALNGRPIVSYQGGVLYLPNLTLAPEDEFCILGVINDVPDGVNNSFGYSPGYAQGAYFQRIYGNLAWVYSFYFGGPQVYLPQYRGPGFYNTFNMSWRKFQQPAECVTFWNGSEYTATAGGNSTPEQHFTGTSTFQIGDGQNLPLRIPTLGLFSALEATYRKPINDFLKIYYGI